jgi:hypothetical protein
MRHRSNINEGLRASDLVRLVNHRFSVDQYKSKMGNDRDTIVLAFQVNEKHPAEDMVEFIEKGYEFVLDADKSSGEERNGKYSVFVEIERNRKAPANVKTLVDGLSKLCAVDEWKFKYYRQSMPVDFSEKAFADLVPITPDDYDAMIEERRRQEVGKILEQGVASVIRVSDDHTIRLSKPFAGDLTLVLEDIGSYTNVVKAIKGPVQLDEASNSEVIYLEKYLGVRDIYKIANQFVIRNGDRAVSVSWSNR